MITVGLVKELHFIASAIQDVFYLKLFKGERNDNELCLKMTPAGQLNVWYDGHEIWSEKVDGVTSFFGVESCDAIARIIVCIDNGNLQGARELFFFEQDGLSLDKKPSSS